MLFNRAIFSGLLLVPAVLGAPGPGARSARHVEQRRSELNNPVDGTSASVSGEIYSWSWAGSVWAKANNTFTSVTGTFTVPTPSGKSGTSAAIWVGIDGVTCQTAILQAGISFSVVEGGPPQYRAWYEWLPAPMYDFSESISIFAGDVIKLKVTATSLTTGTATVENLTTKQSVSKDLSSTYPLCGQNAEWIVEDYVENGDLVPFTNFTTVNFVDAVATGPGGTYDAFGATIWNILQNEQVLTNVSTYADHPSAVTIKYL